MTARFSYLLPDAEASAAFARRLIRSLAPLPGAVIYLRGPLGAGKTTLVREMLRALGVQGTIRSPTYTIMEPYEIGSRRLLHMDLYRIEGADLEQLGLDDYPPSETLWFVEWPEKAQGRLPPSELELSLELDGDGRRLSLSTVLAVDLETLRGD